MGPKDDEIRIGVEEAKARFEAGQGVALDVVQSGAWPQMDAVVKGAVRLPPEEIADRFEELPRDLDLIAYCT
jgi:hypothetical protein